MLNILHLLAIVKFFFSKPFIVSHWSNKSEKGNWQT